MTDHGSSNPDCHLAYPLTTPTWAWIEKPLLGSFMVHQQQRREAKPNVYISLFKDAQIPDDCHGRSGYLPLIGVLDSLFLVLLHDKLLTHVPPTSKSAPDSPGYSYA